MSEEVLVTDPLAVRCGPHRSRFGNVNQIGPAPPPRREAELHAQVHSTPRMAMT